MIFFRKNRAGARAPRRRGIALITVLAVLALMTVLVVAIFTTAGTERLAATGYANGAYARVLSDTAVNLAIGQITNGTKSFADTGSRLAWASQPGMIRTYDSDGKDSTIYKLYSGDDMIGPPPEAMDDTRKLPTTWNKDAYTSIYTDLNGPVMVTDPANPANKKAVYPIMDPLLNPDTKMPLKPGEAGFVEGFSITSAPGYSGSNPSPANNPAPMPVKWLYALKDGTLATAVITGTTVAVKDASAANPIVGRVAFWADDETAKVNMNTASEGTYWDVPRTYSMEDSGQFSGSSVGVPGLSIAQPAQKEFQRYPGHPATTSLSPVLGSVMPVPAAITMGNAAQFTPYYALVPRIGTGGSTSGTKISSNAMTFESNRLFANYDELLFKPSYLPLKSPPEREPNFGIVSNSPLPLSSADQKKLEFVQNAKFFLTTTSNAPETTLFNTPRVAIWPINHDPGKRTVYDHLMAFCATVGERRYYFTRSNPQSGTVDYALTDNKGQQRNKQLYQYLQALTSRPIPGYGGNFLAKYGMGENGDTDRDQILTYIYDYIRSTNLQDKTVVKTSPLTLVEPYTPIFDLNCALQMGAGEVIPIRIGTTQGFGRFNSISEACLLFYGTKAAGGKTTAMRALFMMEFASPVQGMACMRSSTKYRVTGLQNLRVDVDGTGFKSLNLPPDGTNFMDNSDMKTHHGRSIGGTEAPAQSLTNPSANTSPYATDQGSKPFNDADSGKAIRHVYPFFSSADVTIPGSSAATFKFASANQEVVLEVRSAANEVIQTIHLVFPDGEFKIPGVKGGGTDHNYRDRGLAWAPTNEVVADADTIVGLQIAGKVRGGANTSPGGDSTAGDTRMVESLMDVPANRFRVHDDYVSSPGKPTVQYAHSLLLATGHPINKGRFGKLTNVASYTNPGIGRQPDVPPAVGDQVQWKSADGSKSGPGDWDSGFGDQKDGAHVNKPDEGDTDLSNTNRLPYLLGGLFGHGSATQIYFSPNRQIPSAMMFGSIPTGVQRRLPWQTLLFNPKPEDLNHPGRGTPSLDSAGPPPGSQFPPDHLLADLFWMPVIEPYAESQAFSTAGKINMNYQIQPFTYIRRDTGLRAVLKATKFLALPLADSTVYKPIDPGNANPRAPNRRYAINLPAAAIPPTFLPFDKKFEDGAIFKSATQICEMNLMPTVPVGDPKVEKVDDMISFWGRNKLTGDNAREKPYVDIYPRLTTKSNTFTIHARVQVLQKARSSDAGQWDPLKDQIVSEARTSSVVERYVSTSDASLPDFAVLDPGNPAANIDQYYKIRVLSTKRFAP